MAGGAGLSDRVRGLGASDLSGGGFGDGLKAVTPPFSEEAEQSVVGQLLAKPQKVGDVLTTLLEPGHFYTPACRALFTEIISAYYGDDPIDPLSIAEGQAKTLARIWKVDESEVRLRVQALASGQAWSGDVTAHAGLVKRDAEYRNILDLAHSLVREVQREQKNPDEIAGMASQTAMQIATNTLLSQDIISYEELGRRFVKHAKVLMEARRQGIELGAYFGLSFLDSFLRGLQPTELLIIAGEPGAGKSAVTWKAAQLFAERQMKKPVERRIGTLVLSLEMSEEPSSTRLAQSMTNIDGGKLREGKIDADDLKAVIDQWGVRKDIPLYFNFTSTMKASQMRALIVEGIRRHNIGLVVIDHMRYFDMDGRWDSKLEEEEAKARFLKQDIATQLNVAVIVLAHTTKGIESSDDRRPRLSHLRGSGQVAAHADFVGFVYRPYNHAKQDDIDEGRVKRTDAELIYAKNRHGLDGTARFFFDPSTMTVH